MKPIASVELGQPDGPVVVFAHGWGRTHADFLPVAELIAGQARCILFDLPGFGDTPRPDDAWDTNDYADYMRTVLAEKIGDKPCIWVGHSFGGRVGLRLAAQQQSPIAQMVIVAGAGVKLPRSLWQQLRGQWRSFLFKRKKARATDDYEIIDLEKKYGSADYVHSREIGMRDIFIQTVKEDQTNDVGRIIAPTHLIYGSKDTATPPAEGRVLHAHIPNSTYIECPEFDHLSVLTRGRHQIANVIKDILTEART
ncbi:pimeloyl-ACP methyl ester carboxylesterase [Yoonia maritima]|uniref:Pimeloyl-ACP methyl ester carboxylesterase n=1 Tax=Yoonia maritima TaxID=1435347 RepID=A0A2T0VUA7_9RHOB|nr:alpha/beta hydrolase [Yoonia maritima]PRY74762.1 pimeloyl-ACP methyl ester carboxylesterase [Yoonia maritima]